MVVIDASVVLAWCFEDEAGPETDELLENIQASGAIVPSLWHLEITNVLLQAERRGRISEAHVAESLEMINALDIEVDEQTSHRAGREIIALARNHKLTTYDAAYLELAMRLGMPLATRDDLLRKAAKKSGLSVLPG